MFSKHNLDGVPIIYFVLLNGALQDAIARTETDSFNDSLRLVGPKLALLFTMRRLSAMLLRNGRTRMSDGASLEFSG